MKQKNCKTCGDPFTQYLSTDKYCSLACLTSDKGKKKYLPKKPIKKVSDKRAKQNRAYLLVKARYMIDHLDCEFEGCNKPMKDIHHRKGRHNGRLLDARFFMSICREHHLWVHNFPIKAKEKGYLI
jgi:hypothetical protein